MKKTIILAVFFCLLLTSCTNNQEIVLTEAPSAYNIAQNYTGFAIWSNATNSTLYTRHWNESGFNATTNAIVIAGASSVLRFINSDYSRWHDVGGLCVTTSNSNVIVVILNTTTGNQIYNSTVSTSTTTNNAVTCDIMFWNGTKDYILVYDTSSTDDNIYQIIFGNDTAIGTNTSYTFPNTSRSDGIKGPNIVQRPGVEEAGISFISDTNETDFVSYAVVNKTGTLIFNWSQTTGTSSSFGSGYSQDLDWTNNGNYLFVVMENASTTNDDLMISIYDAAAKTQSYFVNDSFGIALKEDFDVCSLKKENSTVFMFQDNSNDVYAGVAYVNGTIQESIPLNDSSTERDTNNIEENIKCYKEEADDNVVIFFIDNAALTVGTTTYDSSTGVWAATSLENANESGNIATDDIANLDCIPFPEGDGCMLVSGDITFDIYGGSYYNGSDITNASNTLLTDNSWNEARNFGFLFKSLPATAETPVLNVISAVINSTSGSGLDSDNITLTYNATQNTNVVADWRINGTSLAILNLPFALNSSTTARDYSTYVNTGVVFNATWSQHRNGSYSFNGQSSYVNGSIVIAPNTSFTVEFWFNDTNKSAQVMVALSNGTSQVVHMRRGSGNPQQYFACPVNLSNSGVCTGGGSLAYTGQMYYYVLEYYPPNRFVQYLNGTLISNGTASGALRLETISINNYYVGRDPTGQYFNGTLDDVMIHPYILGITRIQDRYNASKNLQPLTTIRSEHTTVGDNYTVNVTATNYTSQVSLMSNSILIQSPSDSCTYVSGDWLVQGSHGCNISSNVDLAGKNLIFNGTGTVTITANISNVENVTYQNSVTVLTKSGGGIKR